MEALKGFLEKSHILTVATVGEPVWIFNGFYTIDKDMNLIFASNVNTTHGEFLQKDNRVAFSVSWVEEWNPQNKKGLQGMGVCEEISGVSKIKSAINLLNANKGILRDINKYSPTDASNKMYIIKPSLIKYKDDEAYGVRGDRTFKRVGGKWRVVVEE